MSIPRSVLTIAFSVFFLAGIAPTSVGAYATIAPPPTASPSSAVLPDGRLYEEVSPPNKHGYQAGATERGPDFSVASPGGNAVAFGSNGPVAETNASGLNSDFVAERTSRGWTTRSTTARGLRQNERLSLFWQQTHYRDYSPDLSHFAYAVTGAEVPDAPFNGGANIYLMGPEPLVEPTWLLRGLAGSAPEPSPILDSEIVGMSPDASVVYLAYQGQLLPQDASRTGWGIYEYRNGTLSEVGLLPDGRVPANGAMPAATATQNFEPSERYRLGENNPASMDNQVSEDGKRLFFVAGSQLYVREIKDDGSEETTLVSASQMQGHVGEAASSGVALFENRTKNAGENDTRKSAPTYAYASPDGSHVIFQSKDQLTSQASAGSESKTYDFDVDTGALEFLPGVALGGVVTAASDGSSFAFVNIASSPQELDLWQAGPNGGSVTGIAQLPGGGFVGPGRLVDSTFVFQASAPIAGFNDSGGEQVYRYDIKANELDCISCPPAGVDPSGSAFLSAVDQYANEFGASIVGPRVVNDVRGVSSSGDRIFFDSPDPLVGRDTNGLLDAYEWENGTIFLISSGTSPDASLFLDNSESGDDLFFATSDELALGDNDQGYDVYDARIPRPGDRPPPPPLPCSGDVCQGPPSEAQLLGAPPSATFNGTANVAEAPASKTKSTSKSVPRSKRLAKALHRCRKSKSKRKRVPCEQRARKRYGAAHATAIKHNRGRGK
jgi:hypothetical protein